jgi:hypothetical protein
MTIVMETHNSRITLQYKRRYNVWREKNVIVNGYLQKCSNNIIPNGFRLKWKMNLDSCKEKQLSVKEILDETSGKLIEESIKVSKAELIKTNTILETLKHNFDNFEHDGIDTILNIEYKNHIVS